MGTIKPAPLNTDALLDVIYRIQADLKILADQLARERNPDLSPWMLNSLIYVSNVMQEGQPSLRRH